MKFFTKNFGEVELINYVDLDAHDRDFILKMRNHPNVKKWMYTQDNISEASHTDFIKGLERDVKRYYFLVKHKAKIVGTINFTSVGVQNSVEFGIYVNPFEIIKNSGRILEESASFYAFDKLRVSKITLEVLENNDRAVNFYKNNGYIKKYTKMIKGKNVICMEKVAI
jgi:UDP-4-amino-4,6-dideoxy-N-acetyl-beta-L-altrosamine N-acetyltransferase